MTDALPEIRAALREVIPGLTGLLRTIPDPDIASIGTWTLGELAAHVSHAFQYDIDAITGRPMPDAVVNTAGAAELNATMLARDTERDPAALADRIETMAAEFDDAVTRTRASTVDWLDGAALAPSAVAAHLLEECLVHGHDLAATLGRPWPIRRRHSLLVIEQGAIPLIAALPPTAFLDLAKSADYRARFDVRLRGGGRTSLVFDHGSLTIGAADSGLADAYVCVDPTAMMLLFIGRIGVARSVLGGKVAAWGPRPWKLARMFSVLSPP